MAEYLQIRYDKISWILDRPDVPSKQKLRRPLLHAVLCSFQIRASLLRDGQNLEGLVTDCEVLG